MRTLLVSGGCSKKEEEKEEKEKDHVRNADGLLENDVSTTVTLGTCDNWQCDSEESFQLSLLSNQDSWENFE